MADDRFNLSKLSSLGSKWASTRSNPSSNHNDNDDHHDNDYDNDGEDIIGAADGSDNDDLPSPSISSSSQRSLVASTKQSKGRTAAHGRNDSKSSILSSSSSSRVSKRETKNSDVNDDNDDDDNDNDGKDPTSGNDDDDENDDINDTNGNGNGSDNDNTIKPTTKGSNGSRGNGVSTLGASVIAAVSANASSSSSQGKAKVNKVAGMTPAKLDAFKEKMKQRGLIYISRIPPNMRHTKVRSLLSLQGEIIRIYFTPEDASVARRRKKAGGNTGKQFTDGWVEFADKKVAKRVAASLNAQPMEAHKRGRYHDDLWNIKYLPGFKWHHLTERISHEQQVRHAKVRQAISDATRQGEEILEKAGRAAKDRAMEARNNKKRKNDTTSTSGTSIASTSASDEPMRKMMRQFKQRQSVTTTALVDQ